jgi:hypothetical protein
LSLRSPSSSANALANGIAANLGRPTPKVKPGIDINPSPALSLLPSEPGPISGRVIGVLAADGVDSAGLTAIRKPLEAAGAAVVIIAPHGGTISGDDGPIEVTKSVLTTQSVEYDALIVAGGSGTEVLAQDPYTAVNLGEAYRHHKTIAAWGIGQNILRACAIAPGSARRHHHRQADARVRHQAHRGNRLAPPLEPRFCLDLMNTGPGAVGGAMGRVRRVASWRRRGSSRWLCIDRLLRLLAEPPGDTILDEPQVAIRAGRQRKRRNLSPKTG